MDPYWSDGHSVLFHADVMDGLASLERRSFRCIVTSPPYWFQRDYGFADQIGLEQVHTAYVEKLVDVGKELHRVLADDGTFWLNVGDAYNANSPARPSSHQEGLGFETESTLRSWTENQQMGLVRYSSRQPGQKPKDLMGLPWMITSRLKTTGWYLRSEIAWVKRSGMPEKAYDRPTRRHETIFMFSKRANYFYSKPPNDTTVWNITKGRGEGHRAVFPSRLVERVLTRSTRTGDAVLDPFVGSGTTLIAARKMGRLGVGIDAHAPFLDDAVTLISSTRFNSDGPVGEPRMCADCGTPFRPERSDGLYCQGACRQRAYRRRKAR